MWPQAFMCCCEFDTSGATRFITSSLVYEYAIDESRSSNSLVRIYMQRDSVRWILRAAPHTSGCSVLRGFCSGRCYWLSMQMPGRFTSPWVPITRVPFNWWHESVLCQFPGRAIQPVVRLTGSTDSNLAHGSNPCLYGLRAALVSEGDGRVSVREGVKGRVAPCVVLLIKGRMESEERVKGGEDGKK